MPQNVDQPSELDDSVALDRWLRVRLGRRLTLALLAADGDARPRILGLAAALEPYSEMRVIADLLHDDGAEHEDAAISTLRRAASEDADVVLIWTDAALDAKSGTTRLRSLLEAAEQSGLCDRSFVALIGPRVTRSGARSLGYEDGIPPGTWPLPRLAALIAREAVARDELRRRGSSPPCYL
jgi:hypothetical protein